MTPNSSSPYGLGVSIDWGDFPTWLSAITTLGALIYARRVVRIEMQREDRTEALERAQRRDEARRHQADLVAAWHGTITRTMQVLSRTFTGPVASEQVVEERALIVQNASNLPVTNVEVTLFRADGQPVDAVRRRTIAPGRTTIDYTDLGLAPEDLGDVDEYGYTLDVDTFDVTIEFDDTKGERWKRDVNGVLHHLGRSVIGRRDERPGATTASDTAYYEALEGDDAKA